MSASDRATLDSATPSPGAPPAAPPAAPAWRKALARVTPLDVLIALAAIGLAVTLWLPRHWAAVMAANEAGAAALLREVHRAQGEFRARQPQPRFAASVDELIAAGGLAGPAEGGALVRDGYRVRVAAFDDTGARFFAIAQPLRFGATGARSFYVDDTGKLRASDGPVVGPAFPEVQ